MPFGWFGEPPSINRLIGVEALEDPSRVGPLVATIVGRVSPEALPRMQPLPSGLP